VFLQLRLSGCSVVADPFLSYQSFLFSTINDKPEREFSDNPVLIPTSNANERYFITIMLLGLFVDSETVAQIRGCCSVVGDW
jgi:hypothetical protein